MKQLILITLFISGLFARADEVVFDYYGLQGVTGKQQLQEMEFSYSGGMFTSLFRFQDTYLGYFGFGVADILLPSHNDDISDLESSPAVIADLEFVRPSQWLYLTGSAKYYNIAGRVTNVTADYVQDNNYSIFEFPLGLGVHYTYRFVSAMAGIRKSFYYGINQYEKLYPQDGDDIQLSKETVTFSDTGGLSFNLKLAFTIMDNYYIGFNTSVSGSDDYYMGLILATGIRIGK